MTKRENFKWLTNDIDNSLVLKVVYNKDYNHEEYGVFNIFDVLETTGDELEVETANIDDLTSLLTLGIVRFINVSDNNDFLDIPFRNLYKLYENASVLGENSSGNVSSFKELDTFSIIDGAIRDDFSVFSALIEKPSDDLNELMEIASKYGSFGMQEKFDALTKITMINHRRLVNDEKNKSLK